MKILKTVLILLVLCLIGLVSVGAQDRGVDNYTYAANPQCLLRIRITFDGKAKNAINYRLFYAGAATSSEGTVTPGGITDLRLPISHQFYNLSIDRAEVDKELYTLTTTPDCGSKETASLPAPLLSEDKWATAQARLMTFVQQADGTAPTAPVAASSSCTVSTRSSSLRMRAGHSTTDVLIGNMPKNTPIRVIDRYVESIGKTTRIWYRLVKEQAAPTSDAAEVWVGGTVKTTGDCVTLTASAAGGTAPAAVRILPQTGTWAWTIGNTVNVNCGAASADFATDAGQMTIAIPVALAGSGITFDGVGYGQDANGTWNGGYAAPSVQATGAGHLRVDSPTKILGDIVVTLGELPGCTFKIPFWAAPR